MSRFFSTLVSVKFSSSGLPGPWLTDYCPVDTLHFTLYRDDGLDILLNGEEDLQEFRDHLNRLHPNQTWTVQCGLDGGYLKTVE